MRQEEAEFRNAVEMISSCTDYSDIRVSILPRIDEYEVNLQAYNTSLLITIISICSIILIMFLRLFIEICFELEYEFEESPSERD